jgi:hypothetical protein
VHGASGKADGKLRVTEQGARARDQHFAGPGKRQVARPAEEERASQGFLDFADLLCKRRLGNVQDRGGTPEMKVVRQNNYGPHLAQLHIHNRRLSQQGKQIIGRHRRSAGN